MGYCSTALASGPLNVIADIRDFIQNAANGNILGAALNALGFVPVLGALDGASDLLKTANKWATAFPSKTDVVVSVLRDTFIKHLPSSLGTKLLASFTDAPVNRLSDAGIPAQDISKYMTEKVDYDRVFALRDKAVSPADIRYFVDESADLGRVNRLAGDGIPVDDLKYYAREGVPLRLVGWLNDASLEPDSTTSSRTSSQSRTRAHSR